MGAIGIIAEFNPLHSGHKLLIDTARQSGKPVICVLSGNFVQRGDTAIIPKQKRAETALRCGVDVVAELPVLWSMSTAQNFALGGVSQLLALGCDEIIFGSECGNIEILIKAADVLLSDEFQSLVSQYIKEGTTFAAAREKAALDLGVEDGLLKAPNNNLGIEYICAAKKLNVNVTFNTIKRLGAEHDSLDTNSSYVSASLLREKIKKGEYGFAEKFMPIPARGMLRDEIISDIGRLDTAILSHLRRKEKDDFINSPDLSEGIENKLYFASRTADSFEDLCESVKSKRYTLARIRRLILSAFLDFSSEFFLKEPPYVRIIGFSQSGATHIGKINQSKPVVTRATQIKLLDEASQKVFKTECSATDLYNLSLKQKVQCGTEYTMKFLKKESLK